MPFERGPQRLNSQLKVFGMKKLNWRTLVKIEEASGVSDFPLVDIMKAAKRAKLELQYLCTNDPVDDDRSAEVWGDIWCILNKVLDEGGDEQAR